MFHWLLNYRFFHSPNCSPRFSFQRWRFSLLKTIVLSPKTYRVYCELRPSFSRAAYRQSLSSFLTKNWWQINNQNSKTMFRYHTCCKSSLHRSADFSDSCFSFCSSASFFSKASFSFFTSSNFAHWKCISYFNFYSSKAIIFVENLQSKICCLISRVGLN